jgi:tetratricopeptide (TPR) repeat protein
MLSFVINSIDAEKFASVSRSIERAMAGAPYEIVGVHDARSMCDGYRRGLARSAGDPVVFCHDDIELLMHDLPARLARHLERFDVFAPVGARKLVSMNWMDAGAEYLYGAMSGPRPDGSLSTGFFGGETREVDGIAALEGIFIVARRAAALALGWDAETLDGWHGYDTDFSFRAHLAGWRVGVVLDLAILHASGGNYDASYLRAMARFAAKHAGKLATFRSGANIATTHIPMPDRDAIRAFFDHGDLAHWHRETRRRIEEARMARNAPVAQAPPGPAAAAPPASRNAPCPCGSGRRYKDCHGKVQATGAGDGGGALTGALVARMHEALAAQREGRFDDAIRAYGAVIEAAPSTFDAWHMRGVAQLQMHRFDEAEADIAQAIALKPDLPLAQRNLALVASGRRSALAEEHVSRAVLPRYRPLVDDADDGPLASASAGTRCFVLALGATPALVERIAADAATRGAEIVRIAPLAEGGLAATDEARLAAAGAGDIVVAVGCDVPLGDWTIDGAPRAVALVVDGSRVAPVIDRLRELSGQRRRRVRLALAPGASVDLAPLPHARLAP